MGVGIDSNFMVYNLFWYHPLDPIYQANEISLETNGYPTIPLDPVYQRASCCLSKLRHGPRGFLHVHTQAYQLSTAQGWWPRFRIFPADPSPKNAPRVPIGMQLTKEYQGPPGLKQWFVFFETSTHSKAPHKPALKKLFFNHKNPYHCSFWNHQLMIQKSFNQKKVSTMPHIEWWFSRI